MASLIFKIAILVLFLMILVSLGSGLFFLARDQGKTTRVVSSLSVRIGLSLALFALLIIGYFTGLITPHGLAPEQVQQSTAE